MNTNITKIIHVIKLSVNINNDNNNSNNNSNTNNDMKNANILQYGSSLIGNLFVENIETGNKKSSTTNDNNNPIIDVKNDNTILSFEDLKNKKVGIAGGSLDKSWLFLRAYGIKKYGKDPLKYFKSSFAAPPLINGLLRNNELDAGFNYWNYSARLEAAGYKKLITVEQILPIIGITGELPLIGYVFRESYENKNNNTINNFIKASEEARNILKNSNEEWTRISYLTRANDSYMLEKIRDSFRNGIPSQNKVVMLKNINHAYRILKNIGGKRLVGKSSILAPGTIWNN